MRKLSFLLLMMVLFSAQVEPTPGFKMPSGNIACMFHEDWIRCDMVENQAQAPKQPADCQLDWGKMWGMNQRGKPEWVCAGDTIFGQYPVLHYGKSIRVKGIICTSRREGLICRNQAGHGWMLNKVQQRLF